MEEAAAMIRVTMMEVTAEAAVVMEVAVAKMEKSVILMIPSSKMWQDIGGRDQQAMRVSVQQQIMF